ARRKTGRAFTGVLVTEQAEVALLAAAEHIRTKRAAAIVVDRRERTFQEQGSRHQYGYLFHCLNFGGLRRSHPTPQHMPVAYAVRCASTLTSPAIAAWAAARRAIGTRKGEHET